MENFARIHASLVSVCSDLDTRISDAKKKLDDVEFEAIKGGRFVSDRDMIFLNEHLEAVKNQLRDFNRANDELFDRINAELKAMTSKQSKCIQDLKYHLISGKSTSEQLEMDICNYQAFATKMKKKRQEMVTKYRT